MQIQYSDFTEHLLNIIHKDDAKFKKHIKSIYSKNDIIQFTNYLAKTNPKEYLNLTSLVKKYYKLFGCIDVDADKSCYTFESAINELHLINFYKILFMENCIVNELKNYTKLNPIKTLTKYPYFIKIIEDSLKPYIQGYHSIFFNHLYFKDYPMLFLNPFHQKENYTSINKYFLKNSLEYFADNLDTSKNFNNNLVIEIDENILTLSYGNLLIKAILIHNKDSINIFKPASLPCKKEISMIIQSITNKLMPYEIGMAYLDNLTSYIEPIEEQILPSTLKVFKSIQEISHFKQISDMFSPSFAVFTHSIYPLDNLSEVLGVNNNFCGDNTIYSNLSLLSILYTRKIAALK